MSDRAEWGGRVTRLNPPDNLAQDIDSGWQLLRSAASLTEQLVAAGCRTSFALDDTGRLHERPALEAELMWDPSDGWSSLLPAADPRHDPLQLYLPLCSAHAGQPITVGHLGQSLDGFIATASGESCSVTGPANILHLHRLRALCDVVIVGACTAEADNPRLTTRLVTGDNPLRVVLDPRRRLDGSQILFRDGAATTLRVSLRNGAAPPASESGMQELVVGGSAAQLDLRELLQQLWARGCRRIFIEGGGITVSRFLQADLLDRLQVAVAPLVIGSGRPALRLPATAALADCLRPAARVFRMGADILYDCSLRDVASAADARRASPPSLVRLM
jgi:diaminohydroxyphosphoribosylaminopyrimidine deaminase / 5-amino-6-(5-phosphoribosylamino)uracil reductase